MQEDFLHYVWKFKKISIQNLKTTSGESILIQDVGMHNLNSGPDFFNAKLTIHNQLWAGNVEVHVKSSDWYLHNHELDAAYDNVILHVVWVHDTEIYRKDNTVIPTLELKDYVHRDVLSNYNMLFTKNNKWINCENDFAGVDHFIFENWMERLYFERLEGKSVLIKSLMEASKNDWEAVLFLMLAKNFGLKVNGEAFLSIAGSFDFSVLRKSQSQIKSLEALLFGQAGLLETNFENPYYIDLKKEYQFLKQKFQLDNKAVISVQFFRLRPLNFPTIRLSQLANLYFQHKNLFSKLMEVNTLEAYYELFQTKTSVFWNTHFTFLKESKPSNKIISKSFIDLLLINTILPIKFYYAQQKGEEVNETIIHIVSEIAAEKNNVIDAFSNLKKLTRGALHSQALLQLKTTYCDKNKCLNCAIGNKIISTN
ncbi:DUF2851 family protein [Siansivirga zeaxanthinifaciens]|uniref:DUF2851 domain-containing protein n=1 Tax=Siansivirga zeaxanthinifaciens CC-SAMT-1 TaxID=1454006 RepID=A0A0C5W801_9FLAO|nr:DUF2851 family protein [Siansivirga zeaxanthinifaciens]AJR02372.1 hypothetical protein AW14_00690 [Siansivirga zeaxanthinifaciens CC-SAMT-1]